MKRLLYNILAVFLIGFSSCGEKLDEIELEVINKDIPSELYLQISLQSAQALNNYIFDGLQEYAESMKTQLKQEMQKHRQSVAMFGDWDIGAAVFGAPSKEEKLVNTYNSYINYANRNNQKIYDVILGETQILAQNPSLINKFTSSGNEINFEVFSDLEYVPSSISLESYNKYSDIPLNKTNMSKWAAVVLPYSNKPSIRYDALTVSVIKMMQTISFPKAVYAVYNKDLKAWNVGYDTNQAYLVTFIIDNDVVNWEMAETNYVEAYVNSKGNVLKK